ncbi:MAG: helix-turn-helix domain-containing protein [Halobacteria archaeon]
MSFGHSLTEEQTEALRIAWNKGYFETPKRISLEQLSKEFEVTSQALSHRIRTAVEKILENTHLESNSAGEKL